MTDPPPLPRRLLAELLGSAFLAFGPVSGWHFNPVVSFVDESFGGITRRDALGYLPAQVIGCVLGAVAANGMFAKAAISISTHHRASPAHLLAAAIAAIRALYPGVTPAEAADVVLPHPGLDRVEAEATVRAR